MKESIIFKALYFIVFFRKSKNASQAKKKLREVCLDERQCQHWFARFCAGDFNVQDVQLMYNHC